MMSFSATIPNGLKPFLKKYMKQPQTVQIESSEHFQPQIRHVLVPCRHMSYTQKLMEVLKGIQPYVCLIFANTRLMAAQTAEAMRAEGYGVVELHGDLTARERTRALKELQQQSKSYVVATDIAARGIPISRGSLMSSRWDSRKSWTSTSIAADVPVAPAVTASAMRFTVQRMMR